MADFGEDPFGNDQGFVGAPQTPDPFSAPDISPLPSASSTTRAPIPMFEETSGEASAVDFGFDAAEVVQISSQDCQDAFIGGYVPHHVERAPSVLEAPGAQVVEDPRVLLNRKHQELLSKKEKEEAASKKAAGERAKAHITKFNEGRSAELAKRKQANRDAETASPESGVPQGATWEKVNLLINYTHNKVQVKDLSRFKSTLQTCKALNVPVSVK